MAEFDKESETIICPHCWRLLLWKDKRFVMYNAFVKKIKEEPKKKEKKMRKFKKVLIGLLLMFFMIPVAAVVAQVVDPNVITNPPADTSNYIQWFFDSIKSLKGATANLIIAFVLSALIGAMKMPSIIKLKFWDKLGKWKFTIPLMLGAIVALLIVWPTPFSWSSLIQVIVAGAIGNGGLAIAIREIIRQFFPKKTPV